MGGMGGGRGRGVCGNGGIGENEGNGGGKILFIVFQRIVHIQGNLF